MNNYLFKASKLANPLNVVFLCGVLFKKDDPCDKRTILKKYIESIHTKNKVIILEQNFIFKGSVKGYLAYDKIFLRNLYDVESLVALLSDQIFIVHESISTAAEMGIFASNKDSIEKICLVVPDKVNIEEDKLSSFIKYAFLQNESSLRTIYFYPIIKENKISLTKSDYHTCFKNDTIGDNLGKNITEFIKCKSKEYIEVGFKESKYNDPLDNIVSYHINKEDKEAFIYIPVCNMKTHIISLFNIGDFMTKLQTTTSIKDSVDLVKEVYLNVLKNSVEEVSGCSFDSFKLHYKLVNFIESTDLDLWRVIGLILYLLQSMEMIILPSDGSNFKINNNFYSLYSKYSILMDRKKVTNLFL